MTLLSKNNSHLFSASRSIPLIAMTMVFSLYLLGADAPVHVQLITNIAGPRTVESLTQQGILRH